MDKKTCDHSRPGPVALALSMILLLVSPTPLWASDFEHGLSEFRAGNMQQALDTWTPLAQAGNADAQHALGMMHEYGHGMDRNDKAAARWYLKAAEQNMAEAQYRLGVLHENGWGVTRDPILAAKWYTRAAQLGHTFAQHDLAFMHLDGSGVPQDTVEAYKWLKIASAQRADLMTKHLQNLAKLMTPNQIAQGEKLAHDWLTSQEL